MLVIDDTQSRSLRSPVCSSCAHLKGVTHPMCDAFPEPDAIPDEIWSGKNDHRQPFPGDHGIRYEHFAEALSTHA